MIKELNSRLCKVRAAMELINDPAREIKLAIQGLGEYEFYVEVKSKEYLRRLLLNEINELGMEIKSIEDANGDDDHQIFANIDDIF